MTKNNTLVQTVNGITEVWLHSTRVCVIEPTESGYKVTLNSGGWITSTTKKRINEAASEFSRCLFHVKQTKGNWLVRHMAFHEAGSLSDLNMPIWNPEEGDAIIPDPSLSFTYWKEIPFVDGMTFEIETK